MGKLDRNAEKIIRDIVDSEVSTTNPDLTSCEPTEQSDQDDTTDANDTLISLSPSRSTVTVDDYNNVGHGRRRQEETSTAPAEPRAAPCSAGPAIRPENQSDPEIPIEEPEAPGSCLSNAEGAEAGTCNNLEENQLKTPEQDKDHPAPGLPSPAGTRSNNIQNSTFVVVPPIFPDFSRLFTHSQERQQPPSNMDTWIQNAPPILHTPPPTTQTSMVLPSTAAAPVSDRQVSKRQVNNKPFLLALQIVITINNHSMHLFRSRADRLPENLNNDSKYSAT